MKKLAVATLAALSLGALHAADPQTDDAAPPPPAPEAAPKPLPPLEQTPDRSAPKKWKKDRRPDMPPPGEDRRAKFREMMEHHRPDFDKGPGDKDRAKFGHGEGLTKDLNLTPEQQKKARELLQATKPKVEAIEKETREKIRAVFEDALKELRPSLTPEQQAVLDDLQKLRADREALKQATAPADKPAKAEKKKGDDA